MADHTQILILGAGFGGVSTAQELARLLPPSEKPAITLVDQNNYLLFTPMLTEVAGGELDSEDVAVPIRRLSPRVKFVQGRVSNVDLDQKEVDLEVGDGTGVPSTTRKVKADHVVFALGSDSNFHGISGLEQNSLTIKSVEEATDIRNRALALMERASVETDPKRRRELLTFVVGGGGFSGVETMAALNDLVRDAAKEYDGIQESDIRTVIVQPEERLLPEISESLAKYAQQALEARGVRVALKTEVKKAAGGMVWVDPAIDGESEIATHLLVWAGGIKPSPVVENLGARLGHHHGLVVDHCCRLVDRSDIWALGDCAEVPKNGHDKTYAPTAQNATREGHQVAHNIAAAINGQPPQPFDYSPIGELALVGKRRGVASLYGLHVSGFPAWAAWRGVYLLKMPRMANRLRVGINWLTDLVFGHETVQLHH